MSESTSSSGTLLQKTDHLGTHDHSLQRHVHLLESHGQHHKTDGNPQKKVNQNSRLKLHNLNERVMVSLIV